MARISNEEREIKKQCLWNAFEGLKQKSWETGKNLVSMAAVIELANMDERMKAFKTPIGDKSVYTKAKNSVYLPIVEAVKEWNNNYKKESGMANKTAKGKLKNMSLKLEDSEAHLIELQEEILRLNELIDSKEALIQQVELDRNQYASQLAKLRERHGSV